MKSKYLSLYFKTICKREILVDVGSLADTAHALSSLNLRDLEDASKGDRLNRPQRINTAHCLWAPIDKNVLYVTNGEKMLSPLTWCELSANTLKIVRCA